MKLWIILTIALLFALPVEAKSLRVRKVSRSGKSIKFKVYDSGIQRGDQVALRGEDCVFTVRKIKRGVALAKSRGCSSKPRRGQRLEMVDSEFSESASGGGSGHSGLRIGGALGMSQTSFSNVADTAYESQFGFHLGALGWYPLMSNLSLRAGLFYFTRDTSGTVGTSTFSLSLSYLDIQAAAQWNFTKEFYAFGGVAVALPMSSSCTGCTVTSQTAFLVQLGGGYEFSLSRKMAIGPEVFYFLGLGSNDPTNLGAQAVFKYDL